MGLITLEYPHEQLLGVRVHRGEAKESACKVRPSCRAPTKHTRQFILIDAQGIPPMLCRGAL